MASVDNRSNLVITVPRHPGLKKSFSYNQVKKAKTYFQSLLAQGHKPDITQLEDSIQVRVRRRGKKDQIETFGSIAEADAFIKRIESEQEQGLFIDYTTAANVTFAQIIERYIAEECPKLKGGANCAIMLRAILADSTHELKKRIDLRSSEMREFGEMRTPLGANREPMNALEWVQLPFAQITSDHISDFVVDRGEYVSPASVDRQLDLISSVVNTALSRWGFHLERSPMTGVRRPQYFNERNRRVSDDEEVRLLADLRTRVIGGTFHNRHMRKDEFQYLPRGRQVIEDVMRRQPRDWPPGRQRRRMGRAASCTLGTNPHARGNLRPGSSCNI